MRTAACLLLLTVPGSLAAQQPATLRVAAATAPILFNARSDSPVWASADSIVDFRQREPAAGAAASERTVVKVLRDDGALYVLVRAYDGDAREGAGAAGARGADRAPVQRGGGVGSLRRCDGGGGEDEGEGREFHARDYAAARRPVPPGQDCLPDARARYFPALCGPLPACFC